MRTLLLELGTEELPPGVIAPTGTELLRRLKAVFAEEGLEVGAGETFYTPRRIAVRISDVPEVKPGGVVEVQGPPKRAGFDPEGKPTKTAIGFAAAHGKRVEELYLRVTPKGEYIFLRKEVPPVPVPEILCRRVPEVVRSLPFPKTMRWDEHGMSFPRPVRWVLCLFDRDVIALEIDGLKADNRTRGHRNLTPQPIPVAHPADYERVLFEHGVIVRPEERRKAVLERCAALAAEQGGRVVPDAALLEQTVNITEFPEPVIGGFNPDYLTLPRAVLVTALREHQRCFSVEDPAGGLLPYFIAVTNTPGCDRDWVRRWYERAIDARLRDARFFVEADLKQGLLPLVEEERKVTWIEGLGSYYDKTQRLRALCRFLAELCGVEPGMADRAALLSKADLLTQVVREKEFTSLQGVMGGIYARRLGEPEEVAQALAEQYLPRTNDDELPRSPLGGVLSIADKTDNIVATFLTGNIPTGSEDPFGVRRQATGILLVILNFGWRVGVRALVKNSLALFERADPGVEASILELFRDRLAAIFAEQGIRYDIANAVLATVWDLPCEARARARALGDFRSRPEFERLIIGQKRVANILRGQEVSGAPDPALFSEAAEKELWNRVQATEPELERALEHQDYSTALELLLSLRGSIDRLFEDVLIMCADARLRTNRLRLLTAVRALFGRVADLSQIVLEVND